VNYSYCIAKYTIISQTSLKDGNEIECINLSQFVYQLKPVLVICESQDFTEHVIVFSRNH